MAEHDDQSPELVPFDPDDLVPFDPADLRPWRPDLDQAEEVDDDDPGPTP
jgi:hypothetical protein